MRRRREPAEVGVFARFCETLTLDSGRPFVLERFQREMLGDFFGGATETLILIPKKNGKSTLLAALAIYHVVTTPDAECVVAAASRDQATIIFDQAASFIRRSEGLQARLDPKRGYREIRSRRDQGRIRVLAADADTVDGVIPTLALVDELHRHKSAELYGIFRDGLGPREGQMVTISTAGDDDTGPLGLQRHAAYRLPTFERTGARTYARSADGSYVMHEWALDPEADRDDMAVVKQANPASWQTEEALRRRHDSPSMTPWAWARFACGVWLRGEESAIQPHEWDNLGRRDARIPRGAPVWVGMDLGWKHDTTALVPLWWDTDDRRVVSDVKILEPPGDGNLLDDRLIVSALLDLAAKFQIVTVVYDPHAGAQQMVQQLIRDHGIEFAEHSQKNAPMALASARLMEAIRCRAIVHDCDSRLRDHVLNAVERPLGGEQFRFDRARRGPRKPIDGLTALSMAHSAAIGEMQKPGRTGLSNLWSGAAVPDHRRPLSAPVRSNLW